MEKKQNEDQVTKDMQKKKFDRIANDLKKERIAEREARRRALIDIKEDRESRKLRSHATKPDTAYGRNASASTSSKPKEPKPEKDQFAFIQVSYPGTLGVVVLLFLTLGNASLNGQIQQHCDKSFHQIQR